MAVNLEWGFQLSVIFHLPDWFPQNRFDYNTGAPDFDYKNHAEDQLWKHFGNDIKEYCNHPASKWLTMEYTGPVNGIRQWALIKKTKLETFLNRYKEANQ